MKMSKERYQVLKAAIEAVADNLVKGGREECQEFAKRTSNRRLMFDLLYPAVKQLQYTDDHPFFKNGNSTRLVDPVIVPDRADPSSGRSGFELYDDNGTALNDDHIWTALKRIGRELELTS